MKYRVTRAAKVIVAVCVVVAGCSKASKSEEGRASDYATPSLPQVSFDYETKAWPKHFFEESELWEMQRPLVEEDNTPADNPISNAGATLGRVLFYDTALSKNRTIACASCHKAEMGFSDERRLSQGFSGGETARHSMGLANARFYGEARFFWDQRAATLEEQVLMPFQDPVEMGMTLETLVQRVEGGKYYAKLFKRAFGDAKVTPKRISKALAQFIRSMVSTTSRYDKGRAKVQRRTDPFPNFSETENIGKRLFSRPQGKGGLGCFTCHQGEGFVAVLATSNGLDAAPPDPGYGSVTGQPRDMGTFKVPSLKNVGLRPPYMHDGRFGSLQEVLDHYSDSIEPHANLGLPFQSHGGSVRQLGLNQRAKECLIAFLHTLSDPGMLAEPKYSDPFANVGESGGNGN